ncbi:MAG: hypothetical protein LBH92_01550 [Bacteroidales bacterium]|jgi:V/A-type H+-transporting ATPase subunit E|nr:hypothetical protein [Bacteroidales bacterium]
MDNKIQALTEKLYNEGVEKGKQEASEIVERARSEKESLLKKAREEAEEIITNANKKVAEIKKNGESELKLYASQAVEALKSEIADLVTDKIVSKFVHTAFEDKDFMQQLILKLVAEWPKNERLIIEISDTEKLKNIFETKAKELLDKGVSIEKVNGKDTSFTISPADGSYKVNFGEKEFVDYFKAYLRPQLVELLF